MIVNVNTHDFQRKSTELMKKVNPRALIVTTFHLPFNLNIPHNRSLISKKQRMIMRTVQPPVSQGKGSVVEVHALQLEPITNDNRRRMITVGFEASLAFLNHVIDTMLLTFKGSSLHSLSRFDLEKDIPMTLFRATTYNHKKMGRWLFVNNKPEIKNEKSRDIGAAELSKLEENLDKPSENPFRKIQLLRKQAICFYEKGEFYKGFFHYSTVMELYMFAFAKEIFYEKVRKRRKSRG